MLRYLIISIFLLIMTGCGGPPAGSAGPGTGTQPNVLLIMADDMGFTDIGAFGGEIPTPNLDAVAAEGLRFSRLYTSYLCSPTRAMLLTGSDNHLAGLGAMAEFISENQVGLPGYEGYISPGATSMAELMRDAGYSTYMTGKWHLGLEVDQSPRARGFERYFSMLDGSGSHFADMLGGDAYRQLTVYGEDGRRVHELPEHFYSTDYYTDRMLEYIDSGRDKGKPFFAYVAYAAPHWPLQARGKYLEKFRGRYDAGYGQLRRERFARMKELGLVAGDMQLPAMDPIIPAWNSLPAQEQRIEARAMEIHAAMVNNMDNNIGRLLRYLKRIGEYENTLVLFLSDNGADGFSRHADWYKEWAPRFDNSYENIGRPGSFVLYHSGWAQAAETHLSFYKGYMREGGIRKMGIARLPAGHGGANPGSVNGSVVSVMDILPTMLDLAGIDTAGNSTLAEQINGRSLLPVLTGNSGQVRDETDALGMEMLGQRAVIKGDWKLVSLGKPPVEGWTLFNLGDDPAEQVDLSASHPEKFNELMAQWEQYVIDYNVVLPEGPVRLVE